MIYFCADDYGISAQGNNCIENCLKNGILNKVSVLPNGEIPDFVQRLSHDAMLSLHLNLVEGHPLSNSSDVDLMLTGDGVFKHSFMGLLLLSLSPKRREIEKQLYKEIQSQLRFWLSVVGSESIISVDSHQHVHMIPLVFKTLMRVISDEGINVESVRIPAEPISPYLLTPSLYFSYSLKGLVKQWVLKILAFVNRKELKRTNIKSAYFMGAMFSGMLTETKVKKLLPHYLKLAEKSGRNIELGFHPSYLEEGDALMNGARKSFVKFYHSPWRKTEHDTLINLKF